MIDERRLSAAEGDPADMDAGENLSCCSPAERVSSRPEYDSLGHGSPAFGGLEAGNRELGRKARTSLFVLGVGLLGLLGVARWLEPSGAGFGTHQQLGLPACTTVALFGVKCPSCGMTTSWSHFTRGQIAEAAAANTGGLLLALTAGVYGIWAIASATQGRHWVGRPTSIPVLVWMVIVVGVTVAQWIARL